MSSKKSDKPSVEKKDQSVMDEIKRVEDTLKALTTNVNKLKSMFKSKSGTKKKTPVTE